MADVDRTQQPAHESDACSQAPETPPQPPLVPVPTDFRRNVWLLLIILGVVLIAWILAVLWRRIPEQAQALHPVRTSSAEQPVRNVRPARAAPVEVSRVIGSPRETILAAPAIVLRPAGTRYRLQRLFDVTNRADGFDLARLLRRPERWVDQLPTLRLDEPPAPDFRPASALDEPVHEDRLVVLETSGGTRAYPVALFQLHVGLRDVVGGQPVMIAWSAITQTAHCLSAEMDGVSLTWGDAGLLYRGDSVLYDAGSGSLWDPFSGQALTGPMAGKSAAALPVSVWPWAAWRQDNPNGLVLSAGPANAGALGPAETGEAEEALAAYLKNPELPFEPAHFDPQVTPLPAKAFVLGVCLAGEARAYPLGVLAERGTEMLTDSFGGRQIEVHVTSPRTAYATCDGALVDAAVRLWFAWQEVYPDTTVYQPPSRPSP